MSADDLPEPVDDAPDPLACLADWNDAVALHACLGRLKPDRRRLLLAFVDGLSHAEVAGRMRMPIGSVKSSIRRSLRALRQGLEDAAGSHESPHFSLTEV